MIENINALDEVTKGASMGLDALSCIIDKIKEKEMQEFAVLQYEKYKEIKRKATELYKKYDENNKPEETSMMNKLMTYYGIELRTFNDKSDSKIAELLITGTNMGIIEGRRLLNNKNISKDVSKLIGKFVDLQEEMLEVLKNYL